MSRQPDLPCADCGKLLWRGSTSLPAGKARCQPCRRTLPTVSEPKRRHAFNCEECGRQFERAGKGYRFCSRDCYGLSIRTRPENEQQVLRRHRESAAPGLSVKRRSKLLAKWMRQQKPCAYCANPADTVDHVLPLVRGGTNYEGNLVPACRRCNSSKSGRTVIEWRTGRVLPKAIGNPNWQPKPPRVKAPKPERQTRPCATCGQPTAQRVNCSQAG